MPDAAAGTGQEQCAPRRVGGNGHVYLLFSVFVMPGVVPGIHVFNRSRPNVDDRTSPAMTNQVYGYSRVLVHAVSDVGRENSMRSCSRKGRSCKNSKRESAMRE